MTTAERAAAVWSAMRTRRALTIYALTAINLVPTILVMLMPTGLFRMIVFITIITETIVVRRIIVKRKRNKPPAPMTQILPTRLHEMLTSGEHEIVWWRKHPASLVFDGPLSAPSIIVILIGLPLWVWFFRWWLFIPVNAAVIWLGLKALIMWPTWSVTWYCLTTHRIIYVGNIVARTGNGVGLKRILDRAYKRPMHYRVLYWLGITSTECGIIKEETAGPDNETGREADYMPWVPDAMATLMLIDTEQYREQTASAGDGS